MAVFIPWVLMGCVFIGFGIRCFFSGKPVGFWANAKMFEVTDTGKYNRAMGKLWCVFGLLFALLGIPMLADQNSPFILLSVMGSLIWAISFMAVYELVIRRKYQKHQ